jgi:hypothetical protein
MWTVTDFTSDRFICFLCDWSLSIEPKTFKLLVASLGHPSCVCRNKVVDCVWNVMAHRQKPDFVFRRNGRVNLNWRGRQFIRLLAAEVYASAVVLLEAPCSELVWRVMATHSIRQFPLHFPSRASPCAITFQLDPTVYSVAHFQF